MQDRNRNQRDQSHNQDWDQQHNRRQDDKYSQHDQSNQGFSDLDGDGFMGSTGGFYGGTSYLGANYNDWNNNMGQSNYGDQSSSFNQQRSNDQQSYGGNQSRQGRQDQQWGSQGQQRMSSGGNNVRYGSSFGDHQGDYNRQRHQGSQHNQDTGQHRYGAGGNHGVYGGPTSNRISWEQEQREKEYRNQYRGYGNSNQGSNWGSSNQQGSHDNRSWLDRTADKISSWFSDDDNDRNNRSQQQQMSGPYRGKGPRGYQRSAERIRDDVHDRLHDDPYVDASDIEVEISQNEVILKGHVNSREEKRRAEDLVESISGVQHVENRLRVGRPDTHVGGSSVYQNTPNQQTGRGKDDTEKDITV